MNSIGMSAGSTSYRLISNTILNVAANLFGAGVGFVLVPFMFRNLGAAAYGVWVLIGSVFSYTALLQLGLSSAVNRHVPVFLVRGDAEGLRRTTSTATAFFTLVGALCAVFTAALYWNFTRWFSVPPEFRQSAARAILIVGATLSLTAALQVSPAILSGYQRYGYTSSSRVLTLAIRALLLLVLLPRGWGLLTVAVLYGATELAMALLNLILAFHLLPRSSFSLSGLDAPLLREMLAYGINTFLYSAGAVILYKTSELLIGIFLKAEDVARYSIPSSAVLMLGGMVECFCSAIKPMVSDLDARADRKRVREIAILVQKYTLILTTPCVAFILIMGNEFMRIWTKTDPGEMSLVLAILAIGHFARLSQYSNFLVLVGVAEHRVFGLLTLAMALTTLAGSILALTWGWGLVGVAAANTVAMVVFCGSVVPLHVNRRIGIPWRTSFEQVWCKAAFAALPGIALQVIWKHANPPQGWTNVASLAAACLGVVLASAWLFGLEPGEREHFRRASKLLLSRTPAAAAA
jgi:O-antigen/teichoic acid export membrane protein